MKRLYLLAAVTLISCFAHAQTKEELYNNFCDAISEKDTSTVRTIIKDWETMFPGDAEIYSLRANYHYMLAKVEYMVLSKDLKADGYNVEMEDDGGPAGGFYLQVDVDSLKALAAIDALEEGIAKFPDRIDFRLGKARLEMDCRSDSAAVDEIISALERSVRNHNKWYETLGQEVETEGVSYLRGAIQGYMAEFLEKEDMIQTERMIDGALRYYPKDAILLADKGTLKYFQSDLDAAIKYYLKARKQDPSDMLITYNIAYAHEAKGDIKKALKFYRIVAESGNPQFAPEAQEAIISLGARLLQQK